MLDQPLRVVWFAVSLVLFARAREDVRLVRLLVQHSMAECVKEWFLEPMILAAPVSPVLVKH